MYNFTIPMALMDYVPVVFFGITAVILLRDLYNKMFKGAYALLAAGAVNVLLAGFCKAAWKLVLGIAKKDLRWLNKPFVPMQATGFLLMLISFIIGFGKINWGSVLSAVTGLLLGVLFACVL